MRDEEEDENDQNEICTGRTGRMHVGNLRTAL